MILFSIPKMLSILKFVVMFEACPPCEKIHGEEEKDRNN